MKFSVTAVIPTVQYGNIQPSIEVEADTYEEAQAYALPKIEALWAQYAEKPLEKKQGNFVRKTDFFGNEIDYDAENHVYMWNGVVYQSASTIAKGEQKPFDKVLMSAKVTNGTDVSATDLAELWEKSGHVSREFGTVVHEALEVYGKYIELSKALGKEYHIPNHPILKTIVESFYAGREREDAEYEVLVVDHDRKIAGTIDRLVITAPKQGYIEDYKIAIKEDHPYWKKQTDVYKSIMQSHGWDIKGRRIHQYNGGWKTHEY